MADGDSGSARLPNGITREVLEADAIRDIFRERHPDVPLIPDTELQKSLERTLAARPDGRGHRDPVWVFGYGSLLWNPCVEVAAREQAHLRGYHRDFRLRLTYGRGSPEHPGLMLGLAPGGSSVGVALRVAGADPVHELHLVWRRELLTGVYRPRWVRLRGEGGLLHGVAFVNNAEHPCHCGRIDDDTIIEYLATGHGLLGSCAEYLDNTTSALDARGIHDRRLHRLQIRLHERIRQGED
jgi:glutathione-specific gamma-glutamylcyclotransferase